MYRVFASGAPFWPSLGPPGSGGCEMAAFENPQPKSNSMVWTGSQLVKTPGDRAAVYG